MGIDKVVSLIQKTFDTIVVPAPTLPAWMLWCTSIKRPGFSVNKVAAQIIAKNEQCGIPTGKNPDGSENLINQVVYNVVKGIGDALHEDVVVNSAIPTGGITVQVNGANAGGPVVCVGQNINNIRSAGIIQ